MRILVLSDVHNRPKTAEDIIAKHEDINHVFFLGDGIDHMEDITCFFPEKTFYLVSGNCDFSSFSPATATIELGGKRILYTHGHPYNVKWSLARLMADAKAKGAHLVLYGHTHNPAAEYLDGVYYVNPGAVSGSPASYAVIDLDKSGIMPNLLSL